MFLGELGSFDQRPVIAGLAHLEQRDKRVGMQHAIRIGRHINLRSGSESGLHQTVVPCGKADVAADCRRQIALFPTVTSSVAAPLSKHQDARLGPEPGAPDRDFALDKTRLRSASSSHTLLSPRRGSAARRLELQAERTCLFRPQRR